MLAEGKTLLIMTVPIRMLYRLPLRTMSNCNGICGEVSPVGDSSGQLRAVREVRSQISWRDFYCDAARQGLRRLPEGATP
jgi:hypothetical protein